MIHSFNVEIAEEYGIPSAIILQQIVDMVRDIERNGGPYVNGQAWARQSIPELSAKLPYMSPETVKRSLNDLVKNDLINKKRYSTKTTDRSMWYTLTEKALAIIPALPSGQNDPMDEVKMTRSSGQNDPMEETITGQGFEEASTSREEADSEEPRIYIDNKHIVSDKDKNTDKNSIVRKEIIEYLNHRAGTHYRDGAIAQKHINARLSEGYTVKDFQKVIDSKCAEWLGTEYAKFLRPETLFGTKMDGYLGAATVRTSTIGANGIRIDEALLEDEELKAIFG